MDIQAKSSASGAVLNDMYIGGMLADGTNVSWKRVCTTSVPDVEATTLKVNAAFSGTVKYTVKNGICTVVVDGLSSSSAMGTATQTIATSLPKPAILGWHALYANGIITSGYPTLLVSVGAGNLTTYVGTNGAAYYGTFSYPVADDWRP